MANARLSRSIENIYIYICDRPRENQAYCAKNDFGVKNTMAIYDV